MIDLLSPPFVQRVAKITLVLSLLGILALGLAEEGGSVSVLDPVPNGPLPFDRSLTFGLDLTDRSSLDAINWLDQGDPSRLALILLPVDAEIVSVLGSDDGSDEGARALETLLAPAEGRPVGLCLRRSAGLDDTLEVAQAVVDVLKRQFVDRVAYISSCGSLDDDQWRNALASALGQPSPATSTLLPLSVGSAVELLEIGDRSELERGNLRDFGGSSYAMPSLPMREPVSGDLARLAAAAVRESAQVGLVALSPAAELDPTTFLGSLEVPAASFAGLPEGFSRFTPQEGWLPTEIGTTTYFSTSEIGREVTFTFIGSDVYLIALLGPDDGGLRYWLDRPTTSAPDGELVLTSNQARNAAVPIVTGLPAAEHRVTLVTTGGNVAISGFVVVGRSNAPWNSALVAVSLLAIAAVSAFAWAVVSIVSIRSRTQPPLEPVDQRGHPREYSRDA